MTKIYTKEGDRGMTTGLHGGRILKCDPEILVLGAFDELNSSIAFLIAEIYQDRNLEIDADRDEGKNHLKEYLSNEIEVLIRIQKNIMSICANLSSWEGGQELAFLEFQIDKLESSLEQLKTFIIPSGLRSACLCHVVRTVTRRLERELVKFYEKFPLASSILSFVNRASDYFFVLSRYINHVNGIKEKTFS